jgi:small subunit ribosomal protein S17e|tara:strand:+ start:373 stop:573 length:201 start_codon:yes stop_codon:yes gene_type:complete
MGRIKTAMVKRASFELMGKDLPFTDKFEDNKKLLKKEMPSKKVRNKIAGYLARLVKAKNSEKEANN